MRFYYFSLFSWMLWAVYGAVAVTAVSLVWTKLLKLRLQKPAYWAFIAAILIAPWGEELWIAYDFDRLCRKDSGIFIYKTVEVDGYYNDTGKVTRLVDSRYKFIESPDEGGEYRRVERATEQEKANALAWYKKTRESQLDRKRWFTWPISKEVKVVVEIDTGYAWRITTLERPTARYRYARLLQSRPIDYKIRKTEEVVTDSQSHETLARETVYARDAYWFFIALDAPVMLCEDVDQRESPSVDSIFNAVLRPAQH